MKMNESTLKTVQINVKSAVVIYSTGSKVKEYIFDHEPNNKEIKECLDDFYGYDMYAVIEKRFYK